MKHNATIRDVARQAGVSRQTVSRVINNKGEISPDTRQRVLDAMQDLNYRPSRIAQSLTTRRTYTIGLLIPNIANPYFSEIVHGVQQVAEKHNYNVFLANTNWEPPVEQQMLSSLADHLIDGVIMCSARSDDEELLAFAARHCPLVMNGRILEGAGISRVDFDHEHNGLLAVHYLVEQGHRNIGALVGLPVPDTMSNSFRRIGYINALEHCGLPVNEDWIAPGPMVAEGGYQSAGALLSKYPEITALVCHNDLVAIGAIRACHDMSLRVPQDCAIIGHNDISLASMVIPSLTTVRLDRFGLGQALMSRLLAMIEEPDGDFPAIVIPGQDLIKRESA